MDDRRQRADGRAIPQVSVVVPAYNESARLQSTLDQLLDLADDETEVIFVDDGSTDETRSLLEDRTAHLPNAFVVGSCVNRGKGAAVRLGMAEARGRRLVFMDADLATDLQSLAPLVGALDQHHIAIGSRAVPGTQVEESSARRRRMGGLFNQLTRSVTGMPYSDTQCGFKGFQAPMGKLLFALSGVDGFAFDVEVLALARTMDATVHEIPIRWREVEGSHVRPVADALRMSVDVARSRWSRSSSSRVCGVELPCRVGEETALAVEVSRHVRHFDIVVDAPGRVDIIAPFVRAEHLGAMVERVCDRADLEPAAVRVAALDARAAAGLLTSSKASDWAGRRVGCDPSLAIVPALDQSLI